MISLVDNNIEINSLSPFEQASCKGASPESFEEKKKKKKKKKRKKVLR